MWLAGRSPAAEAFASASRQSGTSPRCPESCGSSPLRRLPALARKLSPTVQPPILFYVAVVAGAITFTYWWFSSDTEHALIRTATVLIIACPHALGLAIPLVIAISTSLGAQNGLLVKDRLALERARSLDMVIFDKTGTLTRGSPAVSEVAAAPGTSEDELVAYSAAVESNSEHPLAKAILAEAGRRNLTQLPATNFEALSGRGARALVKGKSIAVGGPRMLTEANVTVPPAVEKLTTAWASDGKTVLYAVADDQLLGAFAVEDEIRPESSEAVAALHRLGVRVAMITGDSKTVADSVARRIGIDEVAAEVLPADKASAVERFQAGGRMSRWSATASTTRQHWRRQA